MAPLVFSTPRCRIDGVVPADRDAVRALYLDVRVRRHLGGPASPARADAVADALSRGAEGARAVRLAGGGPLVGLLVLGPHHDGADMELSYTFVPEHWGRGLATEAVGAVLARMGPELGLVRVVAETQEANGASRRLLEKVGMLEERRLVRFGEPQVIYAIDLPGADGPDGAR